MHAWYSMYRENTLASAQLRELEQSLVTARAQLEHKSMHAFYKEEIARKELQMARADEVIYYLT